MTTEELISHTIDKLDDIRLDIIWVAGFSAAIDDNAGGKLRRHADGMRATICGLLYKLKSIDTSLDPADLELTEKPE